MMKGATHNLVVRTRTDVALYVLNHKRAHLRDLENTFKVTLAVIADPTVSGQQSFIIDRGEQVHTLEAAKALLAAQLAALPSQVAEADDDEEPFDIEVESEVETEETEGLAEEAAAGEESGEGDNGPRRKRRRRRRSRSGEPREGEPARDEAEPVRIAFESAAIPGVIAEEGESEDEDSDEQPGSVRTDQSPGGERRPRRRGRRGGRRRRSGPEDGLAGSIADELGPASAPEVSSAVADDGNPSQHSVSISEPQPAAPTPEQRPADRGDQQPERAGEPEIAHEEERTRRRSTVREKVSFLPDNQSAATAPAPSTSQPSEPSSAPAPAEPSVTETASEAQPRRAGWWSRRFGNGE